MAEKEAPKKEAPKKEAKEKAAKHLKVGKKLDVESVSPKGFWRCGVKFSQSEKTLEIAADPKEGEKLPAGMITMAQAERILAEKMLRVTLY